MREGVQEKEREAGGVGRGGRGEGEETGKRGAHRRKALDTEKETAISQLQRKRRS